MSFPAPLYPTRRADGVDVDPHHLEHDVGPWLVGADPARGRAIVLAPEGPYRERAWCARDWGQSTPHHDLDLLRAMLFAEAAVHVVDLDRQAEGLAPSRPGPLYLLAARLIRDAIGEKEAYREALLWTMPDDPPKARAAAWAHWVANWPEDGLYQDRSGRQRDPFDVLARRSSWPMNEGPPPWYDLATVIVRAACPDVVRDEERRQITHPAAVWERVERALAEYLPKLVSSRAREAAGLSPRAPWRT